MRDGVLSDNLGKLRVGWNWSQLINHVRELTELRLPIFLGAFLGDLPADLGGIFGVRATRGRVGDGERQRGR
jgi:hypothetical protein